MRMRPATVVPTGSIAFLSSFSIPGGRSIGTYAADGFIFIFLLILHLCKSS